MHTSKVGVIRYCLGAPRKKTPDHREQDWPKPVRGQVRAGSPGSQPCVQPGLEDGRWNRSKSRLCKRTADAGGMQSQRPPYTLKGDARLFSWQSQTFRSSVFPGLNCSLSSEHIISLASPL